MPVQTASMTSALTDTFNHLHLTTTPETNPTTSCCTKKSSCPARLARYTRIRRLRKTLYGDTELCRDTTSPDETLVVLKRMNLAALQENIVGAHESPAAERHVIQLLNRVGPHPHLVRYEQTTDGATMFVHHEDLYTVMEYCEDGDLFDHVERQPLGRLAEREALDLVYQIADGLAFLHDHNVAHRDLSLENVLLHRGIAKICDFGLSCDASSQYDNVVGKASYMAPEVARGTLYDPRAADLWSLGIVLFTLITGSPLIADAGVRDRIVRVVAKYGVVKVLELWGMRCLVSTATLALLHALLQVDPTKRLSVDGVLAHPAFWVLQQHRR